MSKHIFREYDIRGVADSDLTDAVVQGIGRGLADMLRAKPGVPARVVVGRDCRISGPRLFNALTQGLIAGGAQVIDVGIGPTPMMYFGVHHLKADGGVMITGSHNPKDENGFKIMIGTASFYGDQIQDLARRIEHKDFLPDGPKGQVTALDIQAAYLDAVTDGIEISNPNIRVVVDAGNGSAGPLGVAALERVGLKPVTMYCDMDGTFPNHHPDPTELHALADLIAEVKKQQAIVGLAWDGDGDRLGVIDSDGEVIWGDRLLALFARRALPTHPRGVIIADVKCSQSLFDDIERHNGVGIMWKTGHSLIKSKMKDTHALMAGEMSGHFFFADRYFGYDDGIYAALRIAEIVSQTNKSVGELLRDLPKPEVTPEIRVDCADATKFEVVRRVREHFEAAHEHVIDIDGVRVLYADGAWGLVRASNTSPKLVLRFEAATAERLAQIRTATETLVQSIRDSIQV
jgi:phosphomannomutase / phosphoglucomutase